MRLAAFVLALVACDPPQPSLDLQLSSGPSQECPSTDCNDIMMSCRMFMSVRILAPDDPMAPFHSECLEIPMTARENLCPIGGLELQPHTLPYRDLEVQVSIYPARMLSPDGISDPVPDPVSGLYQCPTGTTFDAVDGFPIADDQNRTPALGGRGYYRPGDDVIHVTLGCTNLEELSNEQCEGIASVSVSATIDDFDTHLGVGSSEASSLDVRVGQPRSQNGVLVLETMDLTPLTKTMAGAPAWSGTVNKLFTTFACLTVRDDTAQSTTSVTCKRAKITDTMIELNGANSGVRINNTTLDQILAAASLSQFPTNGLTVGVVIEGGAPISGQVVIPSEGTVEYLTADRSSVGGTMTSGGPNGGVFISRDAPFGTTFSTNHLGVTATKIGGRIQNKVTVVVLDLSNPGTEQ